VFISVKDPDKPAATEVVRRLTGQGYRLIATRGTAKYLQERGFDVACINKVKEGSPHIVDAIENGDVQFVINTAFGEQEVKDSFSLRRASLVKNLPYCTTIAGAYALAGALQSIRDSALDICSLQEYWQDQQERRQ